MLGLDYELFFGERSGTVERCLLEPTAAVAKIMEQAGHRLVLFVDVGCLLALKRSQWRQQQYQTVRNQLASLYRTGHDVQLHIHPHWEDSSFGELHCNLDISRYRLHDFDADEIHDIVGRYKTELEDVIGDSVTAYRAGGWCIQPFEKLAPALKAHNVRIDSTVFRKGVSSDLGREFDFMDAPDADTWRFSKDPGVEDAGGEFLEVSISSVTLSPVYFLRNELRKRLAPERHSAFGDGAYIQHGSQYVLDRLLKRSVNPASVDGGKAAALPQAYRHTMASKRSLLNAMGHPKALTAFGLTTLQRFLRDHELQCATFRTLAEVAMVD